LANGFHRLSISNTYSTLLSPDASHELRVDNTGAYYDGVEIGTGTGGASDRIEAPDENSDLTILDDKLVYTDSFAAPRLLIEDSVAILTSPNWSQQFKVTNTDIKMTYVSVDRVDVNGTETVLRSPDQDQVIKVSDDGAFYNGLPINTGTVVSSVSWDANTTSSGEATKSYRTNHLRVFRLAPGIWSVENMGTNPLIPGDSADWVINSIGGGIGDPFFLVEMNIIALGQPSVGHPVTMVLSATSTSTSPNTGNLGSIIMKIKDKDGVLGDPTLAAAYATVKFTYIA
jgi:hypothetical protein